MKCDRPFNFPFPKGLIPKSLKRELRVHYLVPNIFTFAISCSPEEADTSKRLRLNGVLSPTIRDIRPGQRNWFISGLATLYEDMDVAG